MVTVLREVPASVDRVVMPLASRGDRKVVAPSVLIDTTPIPGAMAAVAVEAVAPKVVGNPIAFETQRAAEVDHEAVGRAFADARVRAEAEVAREWAGKLERLEQLIGALNVAREGLASQVEADAAAIAFEAVIRIVGQRGASRQIVSNVVNELLDASEHRGPLVLRVSSDDYEALVAEPVIADLEDVQARIKLVDDPRVQLGGCIIETERGALDARLDTQLERLKQALLLAASQVEDVA